MERDGKREEAQGGCGMLLLHSIFSATLHRVVRTHHRRVMTPRCRQSCDVVRGWKQDTHASTCASYSGILLRVRFPIWHAPPSPIRRIPSTVPYMHVYGLSILLPTSMKDGNACRICHKEVAFLTHSLTPPFPAKREATLIKASLGPTTLLPPTRYHFIVHLARSAATQTWEQQCGKMESTSFYRSSTGTRTSAGPAQGTDTKPQSPNAKLKPGVSASASRHPSSAAKGTNSKSQIGGRSSSGARAASSIRSSTPSPRVTTPLVRVKSKRGIGRTKREMSKITADALASINHSLFTKANLSAKQIGGRVMKEYLQAHRAGMHKIESQSSEDRQIIWQSFVDASYLPHSHELQRLVDYIQLMESRCRQKLQHAKAVTSCALNGIQQLLQRVSAVGTQIRKDTNVLAEKPDMLLSSAGAKEWSWFGVKAGSAASAAMHVLGSPVRDVCGLDAMLSDPHPPAFHISKADHDERERLKRIFTVLESICADEDERRVSGSSSSTSHTTLAANGSPTQSTTEHPPLMMGSGDDEGSAPSTQSSSPISHSTRRQSRQDDLECVGEKRNDTAVSDPQAERTQYVLELQQKLDAVGAAFVQLMNRVQVQHQQYQRTISAQKSVLDAQATRMKLADDVLRDTVAQGTIEALSAVAVAQQLSLELRERMEVSERNMKAALEALTGQSAEVCFDKGILQEYGSLATKKENCLSAFMSQMERQVVEQADVLWKAQQGVAKIWQLRLQWQLPHSPVEASEVGASVGEPEEAAGNPAPLPPPYKARLKECDRATLLTFLERLTMHCPDATTHVIAALDDHDAFCATHPRETAASREELARTTAVLQLLQKLDEEGRLHCSAQHTGEPLSVRLRRLVEQHDAYIDFNETYARALVRQADAERRQYAPDALAFFDPRTPVPGQESSATSRRVAPVKARAVCEGHSITAASCSEAPPTSAAESTKSSPSQPVMPYLSLWARKQRELRTRQCETGPMNTGLGSNTVGAVVGYLERRTPHLAAPAAAPPAAFFESAPSSTRSQLHTAMSASAPTCVSASLPLPPVPPRKGLVSYVLSTYGSTPESTDGNADTTRQQHAQQAELTAKAEKSKASMPFRTGDHQFIHRQREIFMQLD
ncbi:conserved hypothetical protein [Leishmania mexicana MHOM/GT/2001/U1103]|uniref:Uncharacterized protein n=1 Tax=Leishmania mexicana (strain MHOM/GT/2001/U1103) TaxID=929439 RepID=E9B4V5_LEIMU|nr:conserved hypothetical protein [Leishmania mexicana MHOM/GT/2001/U1103]CBZ30274.1 conserved hypothetical protein [Leishmania mexicana MHOM/GT/2001/U1103]